MNGILIVNKPNGLTSFSVVSRIKKFYSQKRVGHAGTLDPMATGVLPILIGKAAVMQEILSDHDKSYRAGIKLGLTTDTGDVTGKTLSQAKEVTVSDEDFANALEKFVGKTEQVPPMYSAIQIDGKRLYDLARQGIEVERAARQIEIYCADVVQRLSEDEFVFDVSCSKGTYIRTLCEDIGKILGVGACMSSLERTVCGQFDKSQSVELDYVEKLYHEQNLNELESLLIPCEKLFEALPSVVLPEFYSKLCKNGCEIYTSKLKGDFSTSDAYKIYSNKREFIGVAELKDYPDGKALKVKYRFI